MIVLDAGPTVEFLLNTPIGERARRLLRDDSAVAPDVLIFEVLAVLRRQTLRGDISLPVAAHAIEDLAALRVALVPSLQLAERGFALRHNAATADALFLALTEEVEGTLLTTDRRLATLADGLGLGVHHLAA